MPILKQLILLLIKGYKLCISPLLGPRCRFYPSCSEYAGQAIQEMGVLKGGYYAFIRFIKCGPFHPGGYDPVPECEQNKQMVDTKCKC
jgi:putative membrane protein insertion efficiency factor